MSAAPPALPEVAPEGAVSVVVVSQGRPAALRRCLMALEQQFHPAFEVIVVADAEGCAVARGFAAKVLPFTQRNISAARNAGLLQAATEIIAYIDDDAAAEPGWLRSLVEPFADPSIAGSGGFVLGRNGISWQWRARQLDASGASYPLGAQAKTWWVPNLPQGRAARVEGTNMAFRRSVLVEHGGFDPAFAFYHDETELCWRLHLAGRPLALVPGAVVHHGVLPSERRRMDRMPRDLTDIGKSSALFLIRHAPSRLAAEIALLREAQKRRLLSHMRAGRCMPGDVGRLLDGFDRGVLAAVEPPEPGPMTATKKADFLRFAAKPPQGSQVFAGRKSEYKSLYQQAKAARTTGSVSTLITLGRSALYHRVSFGDDGLWHQTGGQYGRSERSAPLIQRHSLEGRIRLETARAFALGRGD